MSSMFKKGFSVAREQDEKMKQAQANSGRKLFDFFLANDGEEADLVFLTEEPINFDQHNIRDRSGKFSTCVCTGDDSCPYCAEGDSPKYQGAFLVWDTREFTYKNKDGKEVHNDRGNIKIYSRGIKDITQLDRISQKYGLAGRMITIIRNGSGQSTSYAFERGDKIDVTEDEIMALLPEKLRDMYNGTEESLYGILEEQLTMRTPNGVAETEEPEEEEYSNDDVVIGAEEEPRAKKKLGKKSSSKKAMFKSKK